jgi:hypothetical protein
MAGVPSCHSLEGKRACCMAAMMPLCAMLSITPVRRLVSATMWQVLRMRAPTIGRVRERLGCVRAKQLPYV